MKRKGCSSAPAKIDNKPESAPSVKTRSAKKLTKSRKVGRPPPATLSVKPAHADSELTAGEFDGRPHLTEKRIQPWGGVRGEGRFRADCWDRRWCDFGPVRT